MDELFVINQNTLYAYTRVIEETIPDKAIIPAHNYIRIKSIEEETIEVSAANSENTTSVIIEDVLFTDPFDVAIEYSFLKPLKKRDIPLTFSIDNNRCVVTCTNSRWEVPVMSVEDLPVMEYNWEPLLEVNAIELKHALESVAPFVYNEYTSSISTIHFKNTPDYLAIGASNRFSCASYKFNVKSDRDVSFMISRETASLVANIANSENIYIYTAGERAIRFESSWGSVSTVGHSFEANPVNNYHELSLKYTTRQSDIISILDKAYFREQIKKAAAFSPVDKRVLMVDIEENQLHMQVEDYMGGRRSLQDVDILLERKGTADKFIIDYNQLLQVIRTTPSLGFNMQIPPENGPGMDCIKDPICIEDKGFIFLLMPLST